MSAAHTPGPWQVYEQSILSPDMAKAELCSLVDGTKFVPVLSMVVGGPDGLCVAVTGCGPTSATNARTIAAFPDLIAVARSVMRHFAYKPGCGPEYVELARAALAKVDVPMSAAPGIIAALRELHRVCVGMDHPDQMQRPEEAEYLAAVAGAEAALQLVDGK